MPPLQGQFLLAAPLVLRAELFLRDAALVQQAEQTREALGHLRKLLLRHSQLLRDPLIAARERLLQSLLSRRLHRDRLGELGDCANDRRFQLSGVTADSRTLSQLAAVTLAAGAVLPLCPRRRAIVDYHTTTLYRPLRGDYESCMLCLRGRYLRLPCGAEPCCVAASRSRCIAPRSLPAEKDPLCRQLCQQLRKGVQSFLLRALGNAHITAIAAIGYTRIFHPSVTSIIVCRPGRGRPCSSYRAPREDPGGPLQPFLWFISVRNVLVHRLQPPPLPLPFPLHGFPQIPAGVPVKGTLGFHLHAATHLSGIFRHGPGYRPTVVTVGAGRRGWSGTCKQVAWVTFPLVRDGKWHTYQVFREPEGK